MPLEKEQHYAEVHTFKFLEPIHNPSPFARTFDMNRSNHSPSKSVFSAFGYGLGAGLVGITAMSITQTIERSITGRPTARVPGESILRFFRTAFRQTHATYSHGKKGKEKEELQEDYLDEVGNLARPAPEVREGTGLMVGWATYLGQGAVLGGVRGVLSYYGVRGAMMDLVFMGFTSSMDCPGVWAGWMDSEDSTLTGPIMNSLPELMHQVVYAFVTGFFCDHWVN